jgi:hypothetical protein
MAITEFQRQICKIIARNRISLGTSYVAGGVALNTLIEAARVSRDIDLFHDAESAVQSAWKSDRELLELSGYSVDTLREIPSLVEATVSKEDKTVLMQWARDSAFRFFPLLTDDTFGLTLHPFDLATNKVLALAGRLEVRDWIDVINCHQRIQNLGYLFWAACGKDPGFSPASLLSESKRSSHYSAEEVAQLSFEGSPPDAALLGQRWHKILKESEEIIQLLPSRHVGQCMIDKTGNLFKGDPAFLAEALEKNSVQFHRGTIKGAFPRISS